MSCFQKKAYKKKKDAKKDIRTGKRVYKCGYCNKYHLGGLTPNPGGPTTSTKVGQNNRRKHYRSGAKQKNIMRVRRET